MPASDDGCNSTSTSFSMNLYASLSCSSRRKATSSVGQNDGSAEVSRSIANTPPKTQRLVPRLLAHTSKWIIAARTGVARRDVHFLVRKGSNTFFRSPSALQFGRKTERHKEMLGSMQRMMRGAIHEHACDIGKRESRMCDNVMVAFVAMHPWLAMKIFSIKVPRTIRTPLMKVHVLTALTSLWFSFRFLVAQQAVTARRRVKQKAFGIRLAEMCGGL